VSCILYRARHYLTRWDQHAAAERQEEEEFLGFLNAREEESLSIICIVLKRCSIVQLAATRRRRGPALWVGEAPTSGLWAEGKPASVQSAEFAYEVGGRGVFVCAILASLIRCLRVLPQQRLDHLRLADHLH
jgi:hypothetical protein